MSLQPQNKDLLQLIEHCVAFKKYGGQTANLHFQKNLPVTVLPCALFDPLWIPNPMNMSFKDIFTKKVLNIDFNSIFVLHWHNQWKADIDDNCMFKYLQITCSTSNK
jgi:hypothetical protein